VRVKVSADRVKAEHDDVVAAAGALGLPARDVARRAEEAARRVAGTDQDGTDQAGTDEVDTDQVDTDQDGVSRRAPTQPSSESSRTT
jgi:hypothetical protein